MAENQKRIKISDYFSSKESTILSECVGLSIEGTDSDEDENTAEFSTFLEDLTCDEYIKPNHPEDISVIPPKKNQESKMFTFNLGGFGIFLGSTTYQN